MSQVLISHSYKVTPFSKPVRRAVIRDKRLTFEARGLYIFLEALPDNWICNQSHIVQMSPSGITKLRSTLAELKKIGAIKIEPNRLSSEEARIKREKYGKQYKAGQMNGWRWVINQPDDWAVEAPLKTEPKDRFPVPRETRETESSTDVQSDTKGLQQQGSNIKELLQENLSGELVFPSQLSKKEKETVATLIVGHPDKRAQELLDELSGAIHANAIRKSKVGFIKELVNRNKRGLFVPSLGIAVAVARERRRSDVNSSSAKEQRQPASASKKLDNVFSVIGHKRKK